jgi:hypothetical protein
LARKDIELMGAIEAAEFLGVKQPNLRTMAGLPEPIAQLRCGSIWLADSIRDFAIERAAQQAARQAVRAADGAGRA